MFSAPTIIVMVALLIFPLIWAVWLGFNYVTFSNIKTPIFIGLKNYTDILTDPRFWQAYQFTFLLIVIVETSELLIGFFIAVLLDQVAKRARGIYLAFFLTTYISVPVIAALMFKQLFLPTGLGSWLIRVITGHPLILTEISVKTLIIIYSIWRDTPFVIIIIFAGLQTLLQEVLEAAAIDGASRWQQLRYITIPHLMPLIILIIMIVTMDKYRIFDAVFVLTGMNPIYKADTIMAYNYRVAMSLDQLGKGNAMSVLTVIGILVVLVPFLRYMYRNQIEEH